MNELLKFTPILKTVLWGGKRLASYKGIDTSGGPIGESWELSPIDGMESVVAEGVHKGKSLSELTAAYATDILGERLAKAYDDKFPLLIKFIDTADNLSIQVHPDDELALKRHNSFGKSEMWYSIAPEEDSYIYAGFSRRINAEMFRQKLAQEKVLETLRKYHTRPGDVLFLPAGRIHSTGAGNLLLEVQQASDITYRVYDYNRSDADGKHRELHIEESIEALNFDDCCSPEISNIQAEAGKTKTLVSCKYFASDIIGIDGTLNLDFSRRDSFTSLTAISGDMTVEGPANTYSLRQGETILVPASVDEVKINGKGSLISVYIN